MASSSANEPASIQTLRQRECVVLVCHAETVPGLSVPPIPVQPLVTLNSFFQGHGNLDLRLKEAAERAITL